MVAAVVIAAPYPQSLVERRTGGQPRHDETLEFIERHVKNMLRSMRKARPTPRVGIESGLVLILLAAQNALADS